MTRGRKPNPETRGKAVRLYLSAEVAATLAALPAGTMSRHVSDLIVGGGRLLAIATAARDLDAAIGETADDVPGRARPALLALRVALRGGR